MATERFTREQFEAALPVHKVSGVPLWTAVGLQDGEYTYLVSITPLVSIKIRSSVDHTGFAATTGEDSIRLWLVDPKTAKPMGSKLSKFVTRVHGWDRRLVAQLRELWQYGKAIAPCSCGVATRVFKVKAEGPNKGRFYVACPGQHPGRVFTWLTDAKATKAAPRTDLSTVQASHSVSR